MFNLYRQAHFFLLIHLGRLGLRARLAIRLFILGRVPSLPSSGHCFSPTRNSANMTGSLQHLPGEMLDHIASHLDVNDQSNASKTSSAIWFAFSRRLHTSIAFKGNRRQVTAMLLNFLANNNTPRIQEIKKHAR